MDNNLDLQLNEALKRIKEVKNDCLVKDFLDLKNDILGKKSFISEAYKTMKDLSNEEKKELGAKLNNIKEQLNKAISEKENEINKYQLEKKLSEEKIDITLPGETFTQGGINPFFLVKNKICDIFLNMGYEVVDGPEVESDHYNFELLNIPKDHPARDMQDSFYIDENTLLRTHTSPVQARMMQLHQGKPLKMICPGKTYRRDNDNATHSHQFAQIEGLLIDKNINLGHLKATLELFLKRLFGEERKIRLRSSFFPFTEPSVEVDISCFNCNGKGCSMCKGSGYIEVLGGGMVHPNVLKMNGYDPNQYSGFAFGVGIERIAILLYGIDDIRRFYTGDLKFINQFHKKGE